MSELLIKLKHSAELIGKSFDRRNLHLIEDAIYYADKLESELSTLRKELEEVKAHNALYAANKTLANTNLNSAEIARLKIEIDLLDSLSAEFFQSQDRGGAKYDIQRKAEQRRARLAELTKGE